MRILLLLLACRGCSGCKTVTPPPPPEDDTQVEDSDSPPDSPVDTDTAPPPPCAQPETEPNNTASQATSIEMGEWACGEFPTAYDFDYFHFEVTEPGWVKVDVRAADMGSAADPIITMESEDGEVMAVTKGSFSTDPYMVVPLEEQEEWDLMLYSQAYGDDHAYEVLVANTKPPLTWTTVETEDNHDKAHAVPLGPDDEIWGVSDSPTDFDWYVITTPPGKHEITVRVKAAAYGSPLEARLQLFYEDTPESASADGTWDDSTTSASMDPDFVRTSSGDEVWYLKVRYQPETPYGAHYWYVIDMQVD